MALKHNGLAYKCPSCGQPVWSLIEHANITQCLICWIDAKPELIRQLRDDIADVQDRLQPVQVSPALAAKVFETLMPPVKG